MKGLIALAFAAAALLVPSTAWAAPNAGPTSGGFYDIEVGEMVDPPETDGSPTDVVDIELARGCKRVWAARVYRNLFGVALWRYFQQQGF